MRQLGKAFGIMLRAQVREYVMHADISAYGAPSECHASVSKGESQRMREAFRHAKAVSGLSRSSLKRELQRVPVPQWDRWLARVDQKHNPFPSY